MRNILLVGAAVLLVLGGFILWSAMTGQGEADLVDQVKSAPPAAPDETLVDDPTDIATDMGGETATDMGEVAGLSLSEAEAQVFTVGAFDAEQAATIIEAQEALAEEARASLAQGARDAAEADTDALLAYLVEARQGLGLAPLPVDN